MTNNRRVGSWRANNQFPWAGAGLLTVLIAFLLGVAFDGGRGVAGAPFEAFQLRDVLLVGALAAPGPLLAAIPLAGRSEAARGVGLAILAAAAMFAGFLAGLAAFFTGICLDSPPDPCGLPPAARLVLVGAAVASFLPGALVQAYLQRGRLIPPLR